MRTSAKILFNCLLLCMIYSACVPPSKSKEAPTAIDLSNPEVQRVLNFQNEQNLDSLRAYLSNPSPILRLLAVNAFASFQDKSISDALVLLLKDPNIDVRTAAAFTMGQLGDTSKIDQLIAAFAGQDSLNINNQYNANILEAIGKIGSKKEADLIASVETYRPSDTLLLKGQLTALYRFGLRDIVALNGVDLCVNYLENPLVGPEVKLLAAHFLARTKNLDLTSHGDRIINILNQSTDDNVKMALALALGKCKSQSCKSQLASIAFGNGDNRVRSNSVRALASFLPQVDIADTLMMLTSNANRNVAINAADAISNIKNPALLTTLWQADSTATDPYVKAKLLQAIMKNQNTFASNTKNYVKDLAVQRMNATDNVFIKAENIKVLGFDPYQYTNIVALPAKSKLEEMAKLEALNEIINSPDFISAYKANYIKVKREILYYIASKIREADSGVAAFAAPILLQESNQSKQLLRDSTFIEEAIGKLSSPKDIETIQELNKLSTFLFDTSYAVKPSPAKAIDFTLLNTLKDSAEVVIKTTKGNITIILFPKLAPATVANFVSLCKSDFYDDKIFHRVVPNFVIQVGCPRGDGYGSLDYNIRSELSAKNYNEEGYVGMASAGLHTESSQFFITHSPTPHLDGRYTLFGKVVKGMDVVNQIGVGDKIIDAILPK